jgi:hypothetical protein
LLWNQSINKRNPETDSDIDQSDVGSTTTNESELGGGSENMKKFAITSPISFEKSPVISIELKDSIDLLVRHVILPRNTVAI